MRRAWCVALLAAACSDAPREVAKASAPAPLVHPEWSRNAVIYEVNVRQYTPEGTLRALLPHLSRLKDLGVDVVWVMPIQPIGVKNRKGVLGSYYSISDYTKVNPEFGTLADFRSVVDSAHKLGLKVLLDWVPNHTSFDHPWTTEHKDYYTLRADGSISVARDAEGKETDWTDVADLNYDNREMRRAMIAAMKYWVDSTAIDGFRVDVAWGVPYDFWTEMRAALDSVRPGMFYLAEAEDPKLHQWYDMTYGWEFHHVLNDVAQGKKPVSALDEYFAKDKAAYPADAYRMYFTSNHDENSWQGSEFERMGQNHQAAFVLAATMQNGMPLLYTGQEVSVKKRLRFFEKDTVDWKGASLAAFYRRAFALRDSQPALANGSAGGSQTKLEARLLHGQRDRVYAFAREKGDNVVVVFLNFGADSAGVAVDDPKWAGVYRDWFDTSKKGSLGVQGGHLRVPAHGYRVIVREKKP